MPNLAEIKITQNNQLFKFLKLKKDNSDLVIKGLDNMILELKASMPQEEIAYVEKLVAELK